MVHRKKHLNVFAYNRENLEDVMKNNRGAVKKRILESMEFERTHYFKRWKKSDNFYGIKGTGRWVKRNRPIPKIKL